MMKNKFLNEEFDTPLGIDLEQGWPLDAVSSVCSTVKSLAAGRHTA